MSLFFHYEEMREQFLNLTFRGLVSNVSVQVNSKIYSSYSTVSAVTSLFPKNMARQPPIMQMKQLGTRPDHEGEEAVSNTLPRSRVSLCLLSN